MKGFCFVRGESLSPPSVLVMNCNSFNSLCVLTLILPSQRAYKQHVLECLARYSVKKMPYAILPKHSPSGHKKVFKVFFFLLLQTVRSFRRVVLILKKLLLSSGADTGDVEQARHWKLSSPLDHHLGHSGWFAASGSSYLCAIQGQWTKAFSVLA